MAKTNLKFPRKAEFTILDVINMNPGFSSPTIRKHVRRAVSDGVLSNTGRRIKTGLRGRPAFVLTRVS